MKEKLNKKKLLQINDEKYLLSDMYVSSYLSKSLT